MIVAEKLRALCQQTPGYGRRAHPTARPRDFYDIVAAITEGGVSFANHSFQELVVEMFRTKEVELELMATIDDQREFHREEWPSVQNAVDRRLRDFDYYFDYVIEEIRILEPLWVEDSPT